MMMAQHALKHQVSLLRQIAHGACENEGRRREWKDFPATYFVYSYFMFDIMVSSPPSQLDVEKGGDTKKNRNRLIGAALGKLCKTKCQQEFQHAIDNNTDILNNMLKDYKVPDWTWILRERPPEVTGDANDVNKQEVQDFLGHLERLVGHGGPSPDMALDLKEVHSFIYRIRNRVVHGMKPYEVMNAPDQQQRFLLYTVIVNATMDMVWLAAGLKANLSEGFYEK